MIVPDIDWPLLLLCLTGSVTVGLLVFHLTAAYYFIRYYKRRGEAPESWKIQAKRWLKPGQNRAAAIRSSLNLTLGGLVSGALIYAVTQGMPTPLYFEVSDYGWAYTLLSIPLLFILNDAGAYYAHRLMHTRRLYRRFHLVHHKFVATSPYVAIAVHPFELLVQQSASFLPLFILPFHPTVIGMVLIYTLMFNVIDHSGVRLTSRLPWQGPSMYHDDHHVHFHVNFGQHLMLWDRIHGTLRRPDRSYGEGVFGGRGRVAKPRRGEAVFTGYGS
ncbi:MAG: lathosterol oxidase [Myxococcota bacterium]|jgi:lathosterol oxidase